MQRKEIGLELVEKVGLLHKEKQCSSSRFTRNRVITKTICVTTTILLLLLLFFIVGDDIMMASIPGFFPSLFPFVLMHDPTTSC